MTRLSTAPAAGSLSNVLEFVRKRMRKNKTPCPHCGATFSGHNGPACTVDVVIAVPEKGVVLVERRFPPPGWALPGGFVERGETLEQAAVREAFEETGLRIQLKELLGIYSDPARDVRGHTVSTVFVALAENPEELHGGDDAARAMFFLPVDIPKTLAFDHAHILDDFQRIYARKYGL